MIAPNPEKIWTAGDRMIAYVKKKNQKLCELGILSKEVLAYLKENCEEYTGIATEFKSLEAAEYKFEKSIEAGIVDIYLYKNGQLFRKYD
jgi:hypothetical protein